MIIDIIIVAIVVIGGFAGYKKGLVGILVGFIGIVLSIMLGFMLQTPISDYLQKETAIGTTLTESIKTSIEKSGATENLLYKSILEATAKGDASALTIDQSANVITNFILKGLSFVLVFMVVYIICYILQMVLNIVFDLPILNSLNKIGGVGIGVLMSLIKITILLAIISFISPIPIFNDLVKIIQNSTIGNILYANNIIVSIIKSNIQI